MERILVEDNTVEAAYRDSSEIVTARYYEYIAFLFAAILLIMLFFRFNSSGVQSGGSSTNNAFKIAIIILFALFYFNRKKIYNQITL